jgi:hypothetical protein
VAKINEIKKGLYMANDTPLSPVLSEIAQRYFGNKTLETQSSDALDFCDVAVWNLKAALEAAFEAGRQSVTPP